MVKIECQLCEKIINIPNYVDTEKYEGRIVCQECKSVLYVKLVKGKVQKYKVLEDRCRVLTIRDLAERMKEAEEQQEKDKQE